MRMAKRVGTRIVALSKSWSLIGALASLQWVAFRVCQELKLDWPKSWRVRPRQVQHALTARLRGSSDLNVFSQIFIQQEYSCLRNLRDVSLILDLGANVGYSSAYFLNCFPNARVLAVEPDERNVEICSLNLKPYGDRALLLHGAVWSRCTKLNLSRGTYGDGREWATQVVESPGGREGDLEAWDVDSLINMAGGRDVDLLKVDIEGSELAVFGETAEKWLPRVRGICIELHGPACRDTFFKSLEKFDYELESSDELTICRNIRAKTAAL
jgi:FkbM family methyltransferase